jgi:hypothetical protein
MSGTNGAKSDLITQCCECKRVVNSKGEWVHVEGELAGPVSHGYCGVCFAEAMEAAEEYVRTAV